MISPTQEGVLALGEGQLPGQALKQLRRYIADKRLKPGMKLPPERKLAETFGVGRSALREALQALAVLEVVVSRRGDGTYIRSLANVGGGWPANPQLNEVDFDTIELLEVRKMLEPRAAALAAGRATARDLVELKHHLVKMSAQTGNVAIREQEDFLFHDAVIQAAHNNVLRALADSLMPMLIRSRRITGQTHRDMDRIIRQHTAVYEAIRIGNGELAEEAMNQHLLGVGVDLISERHPL